jgi:hypothetical protein
MRARLTMAVAGLCLGLGLGFDQRAAASGWGQGYCCAKTVHVHLTSITRLATDISITSTRLGRATSTWWTMVAARRFTPNAPGIISARDIAGIGAAAIGEGWSSGAADEGVLRPESGNVRAAT